MFALQGSLSLTASSLNSRVNRRLWHCVGHGNLSPCPLNGGRTNVRVGQVEVVETPPMSKVSSAARSKPQQVAKASEWAWIQPNPTWLMAAFVMVLTLGSVAVYHTRSISVFLP